MQVRRAKINDKNRIVELLNQVLMVHHNGRPDLFKENCRKYTDEELDVLMKEESHPIFVAVDDRDQVLGYAFCIIKQALHDNILADIKTLYIDDLCVDEKIRGQHIGKTLYDAVVEFAKKQNCYNLTLNVWSCNEEALHFYEKCGLNPQKIGMEKILL
ncbi:MAG: GNAT family N-acetyltransferase [Acetivibrio sp.]